MDRRAAMSEAKIKVRATALALGQFTAAEIQRATGLNPSSVQTELQRMKREALLAVADAPGGQRRIGAPSTYTVIAQPHVLQRLVTSIEAFRPTLATLERPASKEFAEVHALLDRAWVATPNRRVTLLRDAEERLEAAEEAELAPLASQVIQAHLRFERARLHFLRREYAHAERELREVSVVFAEADAGMAQLVREFQLTLEERIAGERGALQRARSGKLRGARRTVRRPLPWSSRVAVRPTGHTGRPPVPVGDHVVVLPAIHAARFTPSLVIPDMTREKPGRGTVVAVGAGRKDDVGEWIAMDVEVGDTVLFAKSAGTEFTSDDEEYLILSEKDILAKIED